VALGHGGGGDSSGGVLQETATVEDADFHRLIRLSRFNLGRPCHSILHLAK
jgi:hypothetical protein